MIAINYVLSDVIMQSLQSAHEWKQALLNGYINMTGERQEKDAANHLSSLMIGYGEHCNRTLVPVPAPLIN